jgi:PPOX class probable FMN-dependent enzyme
MSSPWKILLQQSLRKNERLRHSKYFQIATVRPDGRPANRSVVYRGFLWNTDHITFVTDARSNKTIDLSSNPWAEIAWYFPETREQYRVLGKVTVITKDTPAEEKLGRARTGAWRAMSDPGRQQFTWPFPGFPRATGEEDEAAFNGSPPSKDDPVADPFCLCFIQVEEVDLLNLKSNERKKFVIKPGNEEIGESRGIERVVEWIESNVNP